MGWTSVDNETMDEAEVSHEYAPGTKFGVLSDSHGRVETTRRAVRLLIEDGRADVVIHLGDFGDFAVLDALAGIERPTHIVFGNVDFNHELLRSRANELGLIVDDPVGRVRVGGKRIFFTHGHDFQPEQQALAQGVDYLLHGHTHQARDERIHSTRLLNPGALSRASRYNVMVLDPTADSVRFIEVPRG